MTFVVRKTAGRNHYYVDIDIDPRHRLPGVTTIIKAMANKRLEIYASSATADYAVNNWAEMDALPPADRVRAIMGGRWGKRDAARDNGKDVHRFGEKLLIGEPVEVPPSMRGYVESYVRFMDVSQIRAEHIEVPCYSAADKYAGTIDILGDLILPDTEEWADVVRDEDGRAYGILDPKTGKGIYESAALQLCAYAHAERIILEGATSSDRTKRVEINMPAVDFAAAVHIHPDGTTATLVRTDASDDAFRKFQYLIQIYDLQQHADELLYPPTPYPYSRPTESVVKALAPVFDQAIEDLTPDPVTGIPAQPAAEVFEV
jgi:hypothetical protein